VWCGAPLPERDLQAGWHFVRVIVGNVIADEDGVRALWLLPGCGAYSSCRFCVEVSARRD
jgi:hypothetical protein